GAVHSITATTATQKPTGMIQLKQITKVFNSGAVNEVRALEGMDWQVNPGDFVVIVGANGSGKSTLLNIISGQLLPDAGSIFLDGQDISRKPEYQRSQWIARVFQDPLSGTAPDLSIVENFRLAAIRTKSKSLRLGNTTLFEKLVRDRIATLGMGLENKIHQPMGTLSGGQRQALTLLMSVMDELKILLLDEPTAALDPRSAEVVMQTADELIKTHQLTAILITHQMKDAHRFGNRIVQMSQGRIVKDLASEEKAALNELDIYKWFVE